MALGDPSIHDRPVLAFEVDGEQSVVGGISYSDLPYRRKRKKEGHIFQYLSDTYEAFCLMPKGSSPQKSTFREDHKHCISRNFGCHNK